MEAYWGAGNHPEVRGSKPRSAGKTFLVNLFPVVLHWILKQKAAILLEKKNAIYPMLWTPKLAKYSVLSKRKTDTSRSSPTTKHTSESLLTPTPIPETAEIYIFFRIGMTLCFKITDWKLQKSM